MKINKNSPKIRTVLLLFADGIALVLSVAIINFIFKAEIRAYLLVGSIIPLYMIIAEMSKLYHGNIFYPGITFSSAEEIKRITYCVIGVLFFDYALLQALLGISLKLITLHLIIIPIAIFTIIFNRWIIRAFMNKYNIGISNAIIVGAGKTGQLVAKSFEKDITVIQINIFKFIFQSYPSNST